MRDASLPAAFSNVSITRPPSATDASAPKLSSARAYSLSLSPQIIYARSTLLSHLVSSRVYRQLDFLAVGSWWVYTGHAQEGDATGSEQAGKLLKVPSGREDVFQDHELDFKAKRALMKFLRFIGEYEEQTEVWGDYRQRSFPDFLQEQFKVPSSLQGPLLALALSPFDSTHTSTEFALPRIARHLRSIGVFGAGFAAVIPKWGGISEINQVSCRACAVGGGVYVLGKGLPSQNQSLETTESGTKLLLKDCEAVTAKWIVGGSTATTLDGTWSRSISIVSSPLKPLFPSLGDESPAPATAVVVFPSGSISIESDNGELPMVHILVHSSDTGECPAGQCVLYASTQAIGDVGEQLLEKAVATLLASVDVTPTASVLWSARYQQTPSSGCEPLPGNAGANVIRFPAPSLDLAFDDAVLADVKEVWQKVAGEDAGEFLVFEDREVYDDDDD